MRHRFLLNCIIGLLFCATGWNTVYAQEAAGQRQLLIINSYSESAPWSSNLITPILLQVSQIPDVSADVANLNGTFIRNDSLYKQTEEEIFQRYSNKKADYVVLIGNMAFNLRDRIKKEWGDIPMLLVANVDGYAPRDYYFTGRPVEMTDDELKPLSTAREEYNFTFVEAPNKYYETVDMMVRMLPRMKKLVFVADELYLNQRLDRIIHNYLSARYPQLEYERLVGKEGSDLQEYLLTNNPETGILFSTWFYERRNLQGIPTLVTGDFRLVSSSPKPIFTLRSDYVKAGGFVGGYFYDTSEVRRSIASAIGQMIEGKQARDIPFAYSKTAYPLVDYEQLLMDGLSPDICPEGTIFINRPPTFWEQYKWQSLICIVVLLSLAVLILSSYLFQKKKIALYSAHDTLVRNMPVFYTQGAVSFDTRGKVTDIRYHSGNEACHILFDQNSGEDGKNPLFQTEYILRFVEIVLQERHAVTFTHYFKQTGTFYEFIICQASQKDTVDIFGIDTTARHEAEKNLRETNKKLEMTLSVAHIIPWHWDLQTHTIACEAQRILNHLNFTCQEGSTPSTHLVKAGEYFERIHPDDREHIREVYRKLTSGQILHAKEEFRIVYHKEGRQHIDWMEVNAAIDQHDEENRPTSLIGSLLIITERKKQEQALITAREKAKESDRLKSAFLANMSHEIRTPLNAIVGFSGLLATTEDEHERKEFVSIIENNNQLLLQLVSDILDLAKVEANTLEFNYQLTDLNDLLRNVESTVERRLQPGVRLFCQPGEENGCYVQTERNRLSQVLINLLTNACKFTSEGCIMFGYELRGKEVYFYVRDTGLGISAENQARVFERFTKLNNFAQGTGLGLSICQNIVEKMQGHIGVESEGEGKGSTFWFTVPYLPGQIEEPVSETVVQKEMVEKQRISILVAEDNESNYLLFRSILGKEYELLHAWDGVEAVELYKKHRPNIIIMDINMPNMDGYEAAREIRKCSDKVPIIAVTAYAFASDKERIMQNGFNGYVSKPVNAHELRNEILSTINRSFILM